MEQGGRAEAGLRGRGGAEAGGAQGRRHHRGLQQGLEEVSGLDQLRDPVLLPQPEAGHVAAAAEPHHAGAVLPQVQPRAERGAPLPAARNLAAYQHPPAHGRGEEV